MLTDRATEESADGVVLMVFNHYKVIIRNLTWALVASILLIFLSNLTWLLYESQYETISSSVGNISENASVINGSNKSHISPTP